MLSETCDLWALCSAHSAAMTSEMKLLQVIQSLDSLQGLTAFVTRHVASSRSTQIGKESDVPAPATLLQQGMAASDDETGWSSQLWHRFPVSVLQRALSFLADSSSLHVHSVKIPARSSEAQADVQQSDA